MSRAAKTVAPATAPGAVPFRTWSEEAWITDIPNTPPALIVNPAADKKAVAVAALSRATRLWDTLNSWTCVSGGDDIGAQELAHVVAPLAQEVMLLSETLHDMLRRDELAGRQA